MKNFALTLTLFFLLISAKAQTIEVAVNEYVELMEIIARMANVPNFSGNYATNYQNDIEQWFGNFKEHPAVETMKHIQSVRAMPYSAIPALGANIGLADGQFQYTGNDSDFRLLQWNDTLLKSFLPKLSDFYSKTDFNSFFKNHKSVYSSAVDEFERCILTNIDTKWFETFFKTKAENKFSVFIGMNNGLGNYSIERSTAGQPIEHVAVMLYASDNDDKPAYSQFQDIDLVLIHEFCHSFVKASELQKSAGEQLLNKHSEQLGAHGYGTWQEVIEETLVRASTVRYLIDHNYPAEKIRNEIARERDYYGFNWLPDDIEWYKDDILVLFGR